MRDTLVGKTLGQYQIVEILGKGGMATVYKAYQANLRRYVAIKVLSPLLAEDMDLVKRFLREAQSAAALHHPNVITIHDVGSEGDVHYIVTEYLEGLTLAALLEQSGGLPPERVLNIARQIASALDYAHSRGYIHRDIKPSNIMVDPERNDHVTLMDFGLVRVRGESKLTRTGFIMGTPDYMSPEQARGDPIDHRTDVYSLGVTIYHMFAGHVPFAKPTPHAILLAHIMEEPPPLVIPNLPTSPHVDAVIRKAMAKNPDERYEWAGELVADLERAIAAPKPLSPTTRPAPAVATRPQTPPAGVVPYPPTPPGGATPYPSAPGRATPYPATPPGGMTSYPQTPPAGTAYPSPSPASVAAPTSKKWLWSLAILGIGVLAVLVVGVFLIIPLVMSRMSENMAMTATVQARVPTPTAEPTILEFVVTPSEITQGEGVTIRWEVAGVRSVSIRPGVQEDAPPKGSVEVKPEETTVYELVLPNGETRKQQVVVRPVPGAPTIKYFHVSPIEQIKGGEVELSWEVEGEVTRIEISANFKTISDLPSKGTIAVTADKTTLFVLKAYNGDRVSTRSVELQVVLPTSTFTPTPMPTPTVVTPTPTPVPTSPPPTPTPAPPTPTPTPKAAIPPTPTPPPSSGVLFSFERWGNWKRGDQPYGEFFQTHDKVKSGQYAAALSYDFPKTDQDFVVFRNITSVGDEPTLISVWVYGDGSGHFLNVWIMDAENEVWSVHLGKVGGAGWQKLSGRIDPNRPWPSGHVFGPENGKIDYPIRFYGIVLDRPGSGPRSGIIYLDDLAMSRAEEASGSVTATPEAGSGSAGEIGRIVFTVKVGKTYSLYSTDPDWSNMVKIGDTDQDHSTCTRGDTATTLDGKTIRLREVNYCPIAATVGSCPSPNGAYKVNTNRVAEGRFSLSLWRVSDNKLMEGYYEGPLNIEAGINWAPDSSHFLFTIDQSVYRADVGQAGYRRVIPFKSDAWPLQYTPDGEYVYYLKPVNGAIADIFIARPDGSGERNLTNAPIAEKMCPRWRK